MGMFLTIMMYMQRDLSIKPSVERCTIDALENASWCMIILDYVEIGDDIYCQINWHDDLDFETFGKSLVYRKSAIIFWIQEKNWRTVNH